MNSLAEIFRRAIPARERSYGYQLSREEDRSLWDSYVWPIAQEFRMRRYLDDGADARSRPGVRMIHAKTGYFVEVELFWPENLCRYAVHPDTLSTLSNLKSWAFDPWIPRPVAWRKVTMKGLRWLLQELFSALPDHRLDLQSGPQKRINLRIPFEGKEWAKGFGARWDPNARVWWIHEYLLPESMAQFVITDQAERHEAQPDKSGSTPEASISTHGEIASSDEAIPARVFAAGIDFFTNAEAVHGWLRRPARWAGGKTPFQLLKEGREDDVIGALKGLAYGNFL